MDFTALFGPIVGRASITYGRKKGTIAFCILYALGAASTKSPVLAVLFLGRMLSGIGTSLVQRSRGVACWRVSTEQ